MTRSTNFEFMRAKCAELADEAAEIEGLVHRAGPQAINLLCAFGEKLLQLFVLENGGSVNRADSSADGETIEYGQLLHRCENKSQRWHVPETQRTLLDRLRSEGNKAKHRLNPRQRFDALSLLQDAWSVAGWVWKQLQWGNAVEQFVEPPKGGREFDDERRQKLEAINRFAEVERSCDVSGWVLGPEQQDLSVPPNFVGREFVFGKIKKFLANSECRVLLIQGQPGVGKTAIIQKFVSDKIPSGITPFVFCFRDPTSQVAPKQWVRHLYASLVERWQLTPPNRSINDADLEELVNQLRNRIAEVAEKHRDERMLFVIDAIDEAGPAEKTVVSFLQSKFPDTVQVIATARPGHVSLSTIPVLDLADPDLWNMFQADGLRIVTATMPSLEPDTIKKLVQLSEGNTLDLLGICSELRDVPLGGIAHHLSELDERKEIGRDRFTEQYERTWKRLERDERLNADDLAKIENVALLLANAYVPLSERTIKDALNLQSAHWRKLRPRLEQYLKQSEQLPPFFAESMSANDVVESEVKAEAVPLVRLQHNTFAVFIRQHLKDDLAESKSRLADYCLKELKKRKPTYEYAYALRFGPAHLVRAAEHDPKYWNHLGELLTDIFFLEAKLKVGSVFDLADELSSTWQLMPSDHPTRTILKLLAEAIRREIYFIDEHAHDYPQGLFQCVWNLAWWYGNPEAIPYYHYDAKNDSQNRKVDALELKAQREAGTALVQLLERWRREKESVTPGFRWLCSRRPPDVALGGLQLTVIPENRGGGWWVNCSANGKRIAGGGRSSLRVWDAETLTEVARMPEWDGQKYSLQAAAVSPDGNTVIVAYSERKFVVKEAENPDSVPLLVAWDIRSCGVKTITHEHKQRISEIAFSPDGTRFATAASWDTSIRLWDAKTLDEVFVLPESGVTSLCFSPDGHRIISGSDAIRIWDAGNGQQIDVFNVFAPEEGRKQLWKVCVSPDGTRIATNLNNDLVILDAETGDELVRTPINLPDDEMDGMCFSPDGKRIAFSNTWHGLIRVSDAITGKTIRDIREHEVGSVCFLPDGKRILGGAWNGTIRIWNVESEPSATGLVICDPDEFVISFFGFREHGKKIVSHSEGVQRVWDGQSGLSLQSFESGGYEPEYSANSERCVEFSSTDDEGVVFLQVRDTRTGEVLFRHRRKWPDALVRDNFKLSPDGEKVSFVDVTGEKNQVVRVFDVASGQEVVRLNGHESTIQHQCFSANGARIATASQDRTVRIWDAITGELLTTIRNDVAVRKVWFSPAGTQVVSVDEECVLRLYDSGTGHEQVVLEQIKLKVNNLRYSPDICFSPDGTKIVGRGHQFDASCSIFIWDTKSGVLLKVIRGYGDIQAIAAGVEDSSFRLLVRDGETIVETASGQIAARYPDRFGQIATHPDGRTWAGTSSNYLALIHLEGGNNS